MSSFQFVISSGALLAAARLALPLVANNPLVPVLENLLLTVADGQLTLRSSNMNTTFTTAPLAVQAAGAGSICVPAKLLVQTLSALPDQPVTLTVDSETYAIGLKAARSKYQMAGENPYDFPRPSQSEYTTSGGAVHHLSLPAAVWAEGLTAVLPFVSGDTLRPEITGVLLVPEHDAVRLVSCDGFRVAMFRRELPADAPPMPAGPASTDYILPVDALKLLQSLLKEKTGAGDIITRLTPDYLSMELAAGQLQFRLIDSRYPRWKEVIPDHYRDELRADRDELLAGLKRASLYANEKSRQVSLLMGWAGSSEEIQLRAESLDFSNEGQETLSAFYEGEARAFSFNATYLAQCLQALPAGDVLMTTAGDVNRAVMWRAADVPDSFDAPMRLLLMPTIPTHAYAA